LYHIIECPSIENFKAILRQNIIKTCPVTIEDVNVAERIFGPDIGTLKGKSTRKKPTPVKSDLIEIPRELKQLHQDLTFCMDIMFINGMRMLTGIDRSIRFRALTALDSRSESDIYRCIDAIFRLYSKAGLKITRFSLRSRIPRYDGQSLRRLGHRNELHNRGGTRPRSRAK
jgi:hypothetical protein